MWNSTTVKDPGLPELDATAPNFSTIDKTMKTLGTNAFWVVILVFFISL